MKGRLQLGAFLLLGPLLCGESPSTVNAALSLNRRAEECFGLGEYSQAIETFAAVSRYVKDYPLGKGFNQLTYDIPILDVVGARSRLVMVPNPIVHRCLVLYVKKTSLSRNPAATNSLTSEMIRRADISQGSFTRYVELLSEGRLTLHFERHLLDALLTAVATATNTYDGDLLAIHKAEISSIRPFPEALLARMDRFDSLLIYWDATGLTGRPTGGVWPVPIGGGRQVLRGYMQFPGNYEWPGTLLHEFFHTLEDLYGISPRHGFNDGTRKRFPGWEGVGQFDYYRWHFKTTLIPKGFDRLVLAGGE